MYAYADADRAHEEKMSRDEAIEAIYEEMMEDRELVREAVIDTRNKYRNAKSGGEFSRLVRSYVWDMAASEHGFNLFRRKLEGGSGD